MNQDELWQKISGYLEETMSKESFDLWIKPVTPVSYDDEALTLQVPNKFFEADGRVVDSTGADWNEAKS